jgi:hypothetical protein
MLSLISSYLRAWCRDNPADSPGDLEVLSLSPLVPVRLPLERQSGTAQASVDRPLATLVLRSQLHDRHALLPAGPDRFVISDSSALAAHSRRIAKDSVDYIAGKAKRSGGAADALTPHRRLDELPRHFINGWKCGEAPAARAPGYTGRLQRIADGLGSHPERAGNLGNRLLLFYIHPAQRLALEFCHYLPLVTGTPGISALRVNISQHRSDRSNRAQSSLSWSRSES